MVSPWRPAPDRGPRGYGFGDRDDARVLWGLRMAEACGLTDDYMAAVSEARGWKD